MSEREPLWDYPHPHTLHTRVRAEDIDGLNHTNNTVYVKWCEQVAWSHSEAMGLTLANYRELDRAMAISQAQYNYLQASYEGEDIVVGTWLVGWDCKLTMNREFQVIRPADGTTLLRAAMSLVCIELSSGKPRRMPKAFTEGYGPAVLTATHMQQNCRLPT